MFFGQTKPISKPISYNVSGINGLRVLRATGSGDGTVEAAFDAGCLWRRKNHIKIPAFDWMDRGDAASG